MVSRASRRVYGGAKVGMVDPSRPESDLGGVGFARSKREKKMFAPEVDGPSVGSLAHRGFDNR
jgi:hypothetical protein